MKFVINVQWIIEMACKLINSKHWAEGTGHIFFYPCNRKKNLRSRKEVQQLRKCMCLCVIKMSDEIVIIIQQAGRQAIGECKNECQELLAAGQIRRTKKKKTIEIIINLLSTEKKWKRREVLTTGQWPTALDNTAIVLGNSVPQSSESTDIESARVVGKMRKGRR